MEQKMLKKLLSMDMTIARPDPSKLGEMVFQMEEEADYSRYDRLLPLLMDAIEQGQVEAALVRRFQKQLQLPRFAQAREVYDRKQQKQSAQDMARDLGWTVEEVYKAEYRAVLAFRFAKHHLLEDRQAENLSSGNRLSLGK